MARKRPRLNPEEIFFDRGQTPSNNVVPSYNDIYFPEEKKKERWEIARSTPWTQQTAPTTAPTAKHKQPRAKKIAYNRDQQKLVVGFPDGAWVSWEGVPADVWTRLKTSQSTGKFLWNEGFDSRGPNGLQYVMDVNFDPEEMDENTRVMFNE